MSTPRRPPVDPLAQEALLVVGGGALGGLVGWAIGYPAGWVGGWLLLGSWRCRCGRVRHGRCRASWRYTSSTPALGRPPRSRTVPAASAPVVIGHRGAPGYLPEHTRASYRLAIALGADAIEPDLVMTRDGVLVARHENDLGCSTDVARRPEFASRRTTRTVAGREVTGWFVEDFTLAEVKTLRAVERWPTTRASSARSDRVHEVITFDEVLLLAQEESRNVGRDIGVYAELKWSSYFASVGLPLEPAVLASLRDHRLDRRDSPVHVMSFETANLRWLRDHSDVRLAQLVAVTGAPADCVASCDPTTYDDLVTPSGLRAVSRYADVLAVAKDRFVGAPARTGRGPHGRRRAPRGPEGARLHGPQREPLPRPRLPDQPRARRLRGRPRRDPRASSTWASTACSRTSPTPPCSPGRSGCRCDPRDVIRREHPSPRVV